MTNDQFKYILSIDSEISEVLNIYLNYQSKKRDVEAFLEELRNLLNREDFDIDADLILIRKKKQGENQFFSTLYTLLDLNYDADDVVKRLKELNIEEYSMRWFSLMDNVRVKEVEQ